MRVGIVGSSVVVAGSAALAAFAPGAGAAASGQYNAAAQAASGNVTAAGQPVPGAKVSVTQDTGQRSDAIPSDQVTGQLSSAVQKAIPGSKISISGSSLLAVEAYASDTGNSSGCAAVLASDCTQGTAGSMTYRIGLGSLGSALSGLGGIGGDTLQLTILGPNAFCKLGPNGTGPVTSTKQGNVKAQLLDSNDQPIDDPVNNLVGGNLLGQLGSISALSSATDALSAASPVKLVNKKGTTQQSGGTASAKTGEFGLTVGSTKVLDIQGAQVSCGPNTLQAGATPPPPPSSPEGPGDSATSPNPSPTDQASTATTQQKGLKKIQTDEGRSASAAPAWLALNGMP